MYKRYKILAAIIIALMVISNVTVDFSVINNGAGGGHFVQLGASEAWGESTTSTVVSQAYDISGNGGRKLVRLSNGWLVCVVLNNTTFIHLVSKDNGLNWSQLCYHSTAYSGVKYWAVASYHTNVYIIYNSDNASNLGILKYNATEVTNTDISSSVGTFESGQISMGPGCSLAIDNIGTLYAAWCSKNNSYPNSYNVRCSKSIDGGNTWEVPIQVTMESGMSNYFRNPSIIIMNDGKIGITCDYGTNSYGIYILKNDTSLSISPAWMNSSWSQRNLSTGSYIQSNPSAVVSPDGVIHVVWHGYDSTDISKVNIRYAKSTDGGITWSTVLKLTSGNVGDQAYPSIADDTNNKLYVYWEGAVATVPTRFEIRSIIFDGRTWGDITEITTKSHNNIMYPTLCDNYANFTAPLCIYQDNQAGVIKFTGQVGSPTIFKSTSPSQNTTFSELDTGIVPKIEVSDTENDTLTCKMYIDTETTPRDTKVVTDTKTTTQTAIFSPVNMSKLSEGQHTMKFEVSNGNSSTQSTVNFKVDKSPKIDNIDIAVTSNAITATCLLSDGIGLTGSSITIGNNQDSWKPAGGVTSMAAITSGSGLLCNTSYPVTFKAKDTAGHITTSSQDVYTRAVTPTISAITSSRNINVAIGEQDPAGQNPDGTEYQLMCGSKYVTASGALASTPTWARFKNKAVTITGLLPQTEYALKIKARNGDGAETETYTLGTPLTVDQGPPAKPENVAAAASKEGIAVSWDPVDYATGYQVLIDSASNNSTPQAITTNIYYLHDIHDAGEHTYKVRAVKDALAGEYADAVTAAAPPAPLGLPATISAISTSPTSIALSWNAISGATSYELEADGEKITTGFKYDTELNLVKYTHKNLNINSQHTYRVRAWSSDTAGEWSNRVTAGTAALTSLQAPSLDNAKASDTTMTITWKPVPGAQEYEVTFDGVLFENVKSNNFIMYGLTPDSNHSFIVKAICDTDSVTGVVATSGTAMTMLLPTPQITSYSEAENSISLNWNAVSGADSYLVTRDGVQKATVTGNTYTDTTNLTPNAIYAYQIKAVKSTKGSAYSDPMSLQTLPKRPGIPGIQSVLASRNEIRLKWTPATTSSAVNYDVMLDGVEIDNDDRTMYTHDGLLPNTVHKYRIRSKDKLIESEWSSEITVKTLPGNPIAPRDITVVSASTNVKLAWVPQDGDLSYDVEVYDSVPNNTAGAADAGSFSLLKSIGGITKNEYIQRGELDGVAREINLQEYMYRIRSHNLAGVSDWSGYIINNSIKARAKRTETTNLGLTATDITDFGQYTMTVTYNKDVLDVEDLCMQTAAKEIQPGNVTGSSIVITSFEPGKIVFRVDKVLKPGEAWTGVINSIQFKAKVTGGTFITYTVIGKPDEN